ncbi:hypothetical protein ACHAPT_009498 [Fusarium lateritium]
MASDTFHLFPTFPKEIQDLIWDAAVRPVPGTRHVHRFMLLEYGTPECPLSGHLLDFTSFGVTYSEDDGFTEDEEEEGDLSEHADEDDSAEREDVSEQVTSSKMRMPGSFRLAIPCKAIDGGPNDSVSALDSSLWMACKASRAAMERRFSRNEWWSESECENAPERLATCGDYYQQDGATHTASYENCEGEWTHMTINHDRDLFCLDSRYLGFINCFRPFGPDFPAFAEESGDGRYVAKPSFLGPNIAFDYDPCMLDQILGGITHFRRPDVEWYAMLLSTMIELFHDQVQRTLWFIDYRLQPVDPEYASHAISSGESALPSSDGQERAIFRSGDSVLIEVKQEDMSKWTIDTSGYQSPGAEYTAFEFFRRLSEVGYGGLELDGYSRLRVLASLAAPGKTLRPRLSDAITCPGDASCKFCGRTDDVARSWLEKSAEEKAAEKEIEQVPLGGLFDED